jgi:NAD(P)-dependent dehydrogenase (short-subunit alcohol dehydrogenase family)
LRVIVNVLYDDTLDGAVQRVASLMAGTVALVSGGNRGIGLAIVAGLARSGMTVYLGSRDVEAGSRAAASLSGDVRPIELDVSDPEIVTRCVSEIADSCGRLEVLVNNAGILIDAGSGAANPNFAVVRETLDVNLFGAWRLSVAALELLRRGSAPRIISVSSGMGQLSDMGGGYPAYRLSKVSLNALTRMLAAELAADRISVNSVCPGWVRTDMGGAGASREPEQGADTVVWLATLPAEELPSGGFFRDRAPIPW